ncbi:MAG: glycosyltransferase [Selenomonadaceae bacterium]|nr:glycosyltransferase [Selenomonadaceae bacterium]
MKVLILSASIGSGHTKAAEALGKFFDGNVEIVDFMSQEISTLNFITKKIYLAALKFIPDLYDKLYKFTGKHKIGTLTRLITSSLIYFPFSRLLKKFNPDVIVCTHPFPEAAASLWKFLHAKSARKFLLAAVLTDYSLHEIWIFSEVDVYFVATDAMKFKLAAQSRPNQEIYAEGIPIGAEFSKLKAIEHKTPTILIMGGGLGLGSIEETLQDLNNVNLSLKIFVVAGQNQNLLSRLKSLQKKICHETEILGYVENIGELMTAADLLITKPGALTMTEAFAAGLPMILHAPIPGPEAENALYAVTNGAAISAVDLKISSIVRQILENPSQLYEMKCNAKKLSKVNAAEEIVNRLKNFIK